MPDTGEIARQEAELEEALNDAVRGRVSQPERSKNAKEACDGNDGRAKQGPVLAQVGTDGGDESGKGTPTILKNNEGPVLHRCKLCGAIRRLTAGPLG